MEEETYQTEGEFAFHSYMPTELKVGMHFLTKVVVGSLEPEWLFFTLEHIPDDPDMFMSLYGAPVVVFIAGTEEESYPLAASKEIGWFNSEESEELYPITDKEINTILNEYDGFMDVECDETGDVILFEGKVIISYLSDEGEEEE